MRAGGEPATSPRARDHLQPAHRCLRLKRMVKRRHKPISDSEIVTIAQHRHQEKVGPKQRLRSLDSREEIFELIRMFAAIPGEDTTFNSASARGARAALPSQKRYGCIRQNDYDVMLAIVQYSLKDCAGTHTHWRVGVMPHNCKSDAIQECYRSAAEARRSADAATNPDTKSDFLVFEQWWLSLARGFESEGRRETEPQIEW
jgi:hypothetical protein